MKHAHARERNDLIHGSKSHPNSKPLVGELARARARARGNERRNARVGTPLVGGRRGIRRASKRSGKRKRVHGPLPRGGAAEVRHIPCAREQGARASSQRRGSRVALAVAKGGRGSLRGRDATARRRRTLLCWQTVTGNPHIQLRRCVASPRPRGPRHRRTPQQWPPLRPASHPPRT